MFVAGSTFLQTLYIKNRNVEEFMSSHEVSLQPSRQVVRLEDVYEVQVLLLVIF